MLSFAGDAEHLLHVGEREHAVEWRDAFAGGNVLATVERFRGSVVEAPLRVLLPVGLAQGRMGLGSVALDREQVVGAVGIGGLAGGVQPIHGDHGATEVDIFQHRGVPAALFMAHPADQRHAFRMGDPRCGSRR